MTRLMFQHTYAIASQRWAYWNYAANGRYFVTFKTKDNAHFLGHIRNGIMCLNDIGSLAWNIAGLMKVHYPFATIHALVAMPDHIHILLSIRQPPSKNVGHEADGKTEQNGGITGKHNPMFLNSLGRVIRWYKGRMTYEARKVNKSFGWAANYHDHVIRNWEEFELVLKYIDMNPSRWTMDGK